MYGVFTVMFLGTVVLTTVSAQQQCLPLVGVVSEVRLRGSISDDPCENITIDSQLVTDAISALFIPGINIPSESLVMAFGDFMCNEQGRTGSRGNTRNTKCRGNTKSRGRPGSRGRSGTAERLDISFNVVINQTSDPCIFNVSDETTLEILQNQRYALEELFSPREFRRPRFPRTTHTIIIAVPLLGSEVDVEFRVSVRGRNVGAFCNGTQVSLPRGGSRSRSRGSRGSRDRGTGRSGSRAAFELCGMKIIYILNICKMHYPI